MFHGFCTGCSGVGSLHGCDYCGGAHYLAGAPSLPPPLTPEQEKALLARMAAGDAAPGTT